MEHSPLPVDTINERKKLLPPGKFFPLSFEKVQYFGLEVPLLGEIEIGTTTKIKNLEKKNYSTAAVTMKIL